MKFDYGGIISRIKSTLERIYRRTNCHGDFFVMLLVIDARIEEMNCSEYVVNDLIRLVSTDKKYAVSAHAMIEASKTKLKPSDTLSVKELYKIFKDYCQEFSTPVFSDIYPIYESDVFKMDSASPLESEYSQNDAYIKGVIAVCPKTARISPDDFLVKSLPSFNSSFYEVVTREYLRYFATGVVNNVISQAASLPTSIISAAGVKYMNFWGKLLLKAGNYGRSDTFVDNINKIAELAYESAEACGRIVFCNNEFPAEYTLLKFKTPYKLNNHKLMRKLLQIVDTGHCLGATGDSIYGIISDSQLEEYRAHEQALFVVDFKKERMWDINYLGNLTAESVKVFVSEYESYKYAGEKLDYDHIAKAFDGFSDTHMADIFEIISSAVDGHHGTMIVFSKEAEEETHRLKNASIPLKTTIDLGNGENSELVRFITSIDGAVLCDETGLCHAIGVILDGFSSPDESSSEDISRGARHNSAYRYLRGHKDKCVIIVISEDGDISVIS